MFSVAYKIEIKNKNIIKKKEDFNSNDKENIFSIVGLRVSGYFDKFKAIRITVNVIDKNNFTVIKREYENPKKYREENKNYLAVVSKVFNKKDYQRGKVYGWEQDNFKNLGMFESVFTERKMVDFVNYVLEKEKIPQLKIIFINQGNYSSFNFNYHLDQNDLHLKFQTRALNKFLALHELAHYIVYHKRLKEQAHGAYFVGIYAYLLIKYIGFKKERIYYSLELSGVDFISFEDAKKILTY